MASKPFRVPVIGPYTTRISATTTPASSSGYVGIGIVGVMIVGQTTAASTKDARFLNCFPQTVPDSITGTKKVWAVKRPGWGTNSTPASGKKGFAILVWTGSGAGTSIISAFDTTSTIYSGTTSLGAITGQCTGITETKVGSAPQTPTLVVSSNNNTAWYYDTGVGVMTQITSGNFPGTAPQSRTLAGTFVHKDGYAAIMTTEGELWASDLNSVTAWTATSFDTANSYPDKGVAAVRFKNFIMCFGSESIEFFYTTGLTPFPFSKASTMTLKVGAVSADAITAISDTVFWCGSTPQGGLSVFQFDGSISRISTPELDSIIILAGAGNITLSTVRIYGRSFVLVTAGNTTIGLSVYAYCVEEKHWGQWLFTTQIPYKTAAVSMGGTMVNYAVSNISTSGKVYLQNNAALVFTDDTVAYSAIMQMDEMDLGTEKRKFWTEVELVADRETSASAIALSYSDDNYQSTTTWGNLDLSDARPRATRLGSSRRRAWILTHAAATPMRIRTLVGSAEIGST